MKCNCNPPLKPSVGFLDIYINKLKSLPMPQGSACCRPWPLPPRLACLPPSPHSPPSLASTLQAKLILFRDLNTGSYVVSACPSSIRLKALLHLRHTFPASHILSRRLHLIIHQNFPLSDILLLLLFLRTQIQKPKFIGSFLVFDFSWIGRDDWNQTVIPDRPDN